MSNGLTIYLGKYAMATGVMGFTNSLLTIGAWAKRWARGSAGVGVGGRSRDRRFSGAR